MVVSMTKDEALKLALHGLEMGVTLIEDFGSKEQLNTQHKAIAAIYEALAQPEQEPVAWVSTTELLVMRGNALGGAKDWRINLGLVKQDGDVGLYTTPPQRKPLTDEEIGTIAKEHIAIGTRSFEEFARRIEAAHGIKGNT
jgi:hypothetical protein